MKKVSSFVSQHLYLIILIFILITFGSLLIGITYAYYEIANTGEATSTMTIGGAELTATFTSTNTISVSDAVPSDSPIGYKDFTLTVKNKSTSSFKLYLKTIIDLNTFIDKANDGVLYYDVKSGSNYSTTVKSKSMFPTIPAGKAILSELTIPANTNGSTAYRLNLYFPKSSKIQNKNGQLVLNAKLTVENTDEAYTTPKFARDSWSTIAQTVKSGNMSLYSVGSEKEVKIDGKNYTVRVANNTTPNECNGTDFSETACGFVVEFVDIVENRITGLTNENTKTYVDSEIRTYLNNDFYNKLPSDLRELLITTNVVAVTAKIAGASPVGSVLTATTSDKIFLINESEITGKNIVMGMYDSSTRQLDYYSSQNYDSSTNSSCAIKKYNNVASNWWLRDRITYISGAGADLNIFDSTGTIGYMISLNNSYGVAPAFRIG